MQETYDDLWTRYNKEWDRYHQELAHSIEVWSSGGGARSNVPERVSRVETGPIDSDITALKTALESLKQHINGVLRISALGLLLSEK